MVERGVWYSGAHLRHLPLLPMNGLRGEAGAQQPRGCRRRRRHHCPHRPRSYTAATTQVRVRAVVCADSHGVGTILCSSHTLTLTTNSLTPPPSFLRRSTRSSGRIPTNGRMGEWPGTYMHSNRVSHLVLTAARPPSVDGRTVRGHAEGGRRSAPTATTVRGRDEAVRRKRAPPTCPLSARVASIRPLLSL